MSPAEIRVNLNALLDVYERSWPDTYTRKTHARQILATVKLYPWVMDQIPWDVFQIAVRDCKP
jgi:hypothetical protein